MILWYYECYIPRKTGMMIEILYTWLPVDLVGFGASPPPHPSGLGHRHLRDSLDAGRACIGGAAGALGWLQGRGAAHAAVPGVAAGGGATGGSRADPADPGGTRERQEHPAARVVPGEAQQQDIAAGVQQSRCEAVAWGFSKLFFYFSIGKCTTWGTYRGTMIFLSLETSQADSKVGRQLQEWTAECDGPDDPLTCLWYHQAFTSRQHWWSHQDRSERVPQVQLERGREAARVASAILRLCKFQVGDVVNPGESKEDPGGLLLGHMGLPHCIQ